jgi:uncharacterized protein (DUF2225 family)
MKMDEHKNKVKISNLKATWGLRIFSKEEFRVHVRACLHM